MCGHCDLKSFSTGFALLVFLLFDRLVSRDPIYWFNPLHDLPM